MLAFNVQNEKTGEPVAMKLLSVALTNNLFLPEVPEVELRLDAPLPRFVLTGYPSPCDEAYTLRLRLAEPAVTNIRLHDITGRVALTVAQDALLPAGSHSMMMRTAEVPSGLYLLVVESQEGRRTEKGNTALSAPAPGPHTNHAARLAEDTARETRIHAPLISDLVSLSSR